MLWAFGLALAGVCSGLVAGFGVCLAGLAYFDDFRALEHVLMLGLSDGGL